MMAITYWRNPDTKLIEGINEKGDLVVVQKDPHLTFTPDAPKGFEKKTLPTGEEYWVEKGVTAKKNRASWSYTPQLGAIICDYVAQGHPLSRIGDKEECPPYQIVARWRNANEEFRKMLDQAEKDRAVILVDRALATAEDTYSTFQGDGANHIQAAKIRIEALRYMAEKDAHEKYGAKRVTGGTEASVNIIIQTGVPRDERDVTPAAAQLEDKR